MHTLIATYAVAALGIVSYLSFVLIAFRRTSRRLRELLSQTERDTHPTHARKIA